MDQTSPTINGNSYFKVTVSKRGRQINGNVGRWLPNERVRNHNYHEVHATDGAVQLNGNLREASKDIWAPTQVPVSGGAGKAKGDEEDYDEEEEEDEDEDEFYDTYEK